MRLHKKFQHQVNVGNRKENKEVRLERVSKVPGGTDRAVREGFYDEMMSERDQKKMRE